jgi:hypothetical protein
MVKLFALRFRHRGRQSIQLRLDYLGNALHGFVNLGPFRSHLKTEYQQANGNATAMERHV